MRLVAGGACSSPPTTGPDQGLSTGQELKTAWGRPLCGMDFLGKGHVHLFTREPCVCHPGVLQLGAGCWLWPELWGPWSCTPGHSEGDSQVPEPC